MSLEVTLRVTYRGAGPKFFKMSHIKPKVSHGGGGGNWWWEDKGLMTQQCSERPASTSKGSFPSRDFLKYLLCFWTCLSEQHPVS